MRWRGSDREAEQTAGPCSVGVALDSFSSPNDWSAIYKVLTTTAEKVAAGGDDPAWKQAILANEHAEPVERELEEDEPVPSCHTCQETLFLTNCPERTCG